MMDNNLHKKIYSALITVNGLSADNVFFVKSDINSKIFPRYVFSSVVITDSYDTEGKFENELLQVSLFNNFQPGNVFALRETAKLIEEKLTKENLSGSVTNKISRCKLDNSRETELDGIFQIDLTFRINLTKE